MPLPAPPLQDKQRQGGFALCGVMGILLVFALLIGGIVFVPRTPVEQVRDNWEDHWIGKQLSLRAYLGVMFHPENIFVFYAGEYEKAATALVNLHKFIRHNRISGPNVCVGPNGQIIERCNRVFRKDNTLRFSINDFKGDTSNSSFIGDATRQFCFAPQPLGRVSQRNCEPSYKYSGDSGNSSAMRLKPIAYNREPTSHDFHENDPWGGIIFLVGSIAATIAFLIFIFKK
jgi:hypothetical protein